MPHKRILYAGMTKGVSQKSPVIEKIGKIPLFGQAGPHIRRAKLSSKILVFFGNFLEISGVFRL